MQPGSPKIYMYRRVLNAKLFIEQHYNTYIDLDIISDEAYFSKFHFIRLFKSAYGKTPHQYLISVRIEHAKILLQDGVHVSNACFSVGFESVSTFTAIFKRMAGQTPAAYRQSQLERKRMINIAPLKFIPNCFAEKNGWVKHSNF